MKEQLLIQLASMKEFFDRSTRSLTEEDSTFAPHEGMFTAAQQVAHAAQVVDWFLAGAFAPEGFSMDHESSHKKLMAVTSLGEARAWMDQACATAKAAIETRSDAEWGAPMAPGPVMGGAPRFTIFGALTDHSAHHRGALTVYARLRGKVPPMPYLEM